MLDVGRSSFQNYASKEFYLFTNPPKSPFFKGGLELIFQSLHHNQTAPVKKPSTSLGPVAFPPLKKGGQGGFPYFIIEYCIFIIQHSYFIFTGW
jgi:hypothetical protein